MATIVQLYDHDYRNMTPAELLRLYSEYDNRVSNMRWHRSTQHSWQYDNYGNEYPTPCPKASHEENHLVRQSMAAAHHLWPETYDQPAEVISYEEIRQLRTRNSNRGGASSYTL